MILVFLGPPASGKGTQARLLALARGFAQISTGDLLREAVDRGTSLGRKAKTYMGAGQLVPDDVVIGVFAEALERGVRAGKAGFILDGFPRTVRQAEALDANLPELDLELSGVVNFVIPRAELVRRATGRRVCRNASCQATYHVDSNPPRVAGKCDRCSGALAQREDDLPVAVEERLRQYEEKTAPLLAYYKTKGRLEDLDADRPIDSVTRDLSERIDRLAAA